MPQRLSQWAEAAIPVINHHVEIGKNVRPMMLPVLYNVQTTKLEQEHRVGIGGISPDPWDNFNNSGVPGELKFDKGYKKTYTQVEYPARMIIERKLKDFDQYGVVAARRGKKVGRSISQKMELDAVSTFANGWTAGDSAGPDGVALCATNHPHSPDNTADTQSNTDVLALTAENVSTVRIRMQRFTDDTDNILDITPSWLLVPPELEDTALKIVKSSLDPDSANNAHNPQAAGRWIVLPWHKLTDTNNWYMIDPVEMKESLEWLNSKSFETMIVEETTTHVAYEMYVRYTFGFSD